MQSRKLDIAGLKEDIKKYPNLYQYEITKKFKVSKKCIHKALKRLTSIKAKKEKSIFFQKMIEQYKSDGKILSYIDESGFALDMTRTH